MKKLSLLMAGVMAFALNVNVQAAAKSCPKSCNKAAVKKECPKTAKKVCPKTQKACPKAKEACATKCAKKKSEKWDFIQPCFWFGVPTSTATTDVYGVKVGAPFSSGTGVVTGIETAVICGATDNINGLQACIIFSKSKKLNGLQFSIINYCEEVNGLQLGVVNVAKKKAFQLGIINYIEENAFPWMPVFNFRF